MTDLRPYTDADVEIVAKAVMDRLYAVTGIKGPVVIKEHAVRRDAEVALAALAAAGRLLPEPQETRTEFEVRWHDDGDGIRMDERYLCSLRQAHELGPQRIGEYGITRYTVWCREHRTFADHSSWTGPWVAVDPDTKGAAR